jgi:hypothetical protein
MDGTSNGEALREQRVEAGARAFLALEGVAWDDARSATRDRARIEAEAVLDAAGWSDLMEVGRFRLPPGRRFVNVPNLRNCLDLSFHGQDWMSHTQRISQLAQTELPRVLSELELLRRHVVELERAIFGR